MASRKVVASAKRAVEQIISFGHKLEEKRQHERQTLLWAATIEVHGQKLTATMIDFSAGGARMSFDAPLTEGDELRIILKEFGALDAKVVWRRNGETGLQFLLAPEDVASRVKELVPAPPSRFPDAAASQRADLGLMLRIGAAFAVVMGILVGVSIFADKPIVDMPRFIVAGDSDQHTCPVLLDKVSEATNAVDYAHYLAESYDWGCIDRNMTGQGHDWVVSHGAGQGIPR